MVGVEEAQRKLAELASRPKGEADYQAIAQASAVCGLAEHVQACKAVIDTGDGTSYCGEDGYYCAEAPSIIIGD